jgi:hypothetical protein
MLEMRAQCERCSQVLTVDGPAAICSYECTFCAVRDEFVAGIVDLEHHLP